MEIRIVSVVRTFFFGLFLELKFELAQPKVMEEGVEEAGDYRHQTHYLESLSYTRFAN